MSDIVEKRHNLLEYAFAGAVTWLARLVTGAQALWQGCAPEARQRIYFANHSSHGDFVLLWSALPPVLRSTTKPVAGADYWYKSPTRRWIVDRVFRAVTIPRIAGAGEAIRMMQAALDGGASLIVFPEGTRNTTDKQLLPFRNGIYWLAASRPEIDCVPVWIANLNRVMPKGEFMPVPLLCSVTFGAPLRVDPEETREQFVTRARDALLALAPRRKRGPGTADEAVSA